MGFGVIFSYQFESSSQAKNRKRKKKKTRKEKKENVNSRLADGVAYWNPPYLALSDLALITSKASPVVHAVTLANPGDQSRRII